MMIRFTTDYNEKEVRKCLIDTGRRAYRSLFAWKIFWAWIAFAVVLVTLWNPWSLRRYLPALLLFIPGFLVQKPICRMLYNAWHRDTYQVDGQVEYTADENGIRSHSATLDRRWAWSCFAGRYIQGDFYILKTRNGDQIVCRISALAPEDFAGLKALGDRYISKYCPEQWEQAPEFRFSCNWKEKKPQKFAAGYLLQFLLAQPGFTLLLRVFQLPALLMAGRQVYLVGMVLRSCPREQWGALLAEPTFYVPALVGLLCIAAALALKPCSALYYKVAFARQMGRYPAAELRISDAHILYEAAAGIAVIPWVKVQDLGVQEGILYLKTTDDTYLYCDGKQFSPEDFEALQLMVRKNAGRPETVEAQKKELPEEIRFTVNRKSLEIENFLTERCLERPMVQWLCGVAYVAAMVIYVGTFYSLCFAQKAQIPLFFLFFFLAALLGDLKSIFDKFYRKKIRASAQAGETQYVVNAEGITSHSDAGDFSYPWSRITGTGRQGDLYYLIADKHLYVFCDRKKVSPEDFAALQDMAAVHMKKA